MFVVNMFGVVAAYRADRLRRRDWLQTREIERLLHNVLPATIAERLKRRGVIADGFDEVTVLFADIVGFTPLSRAAVARRSSSTVLNEIFSAFDELARRHGLEKIKTIGDAYMVVGGLPDAARGSRVGGRRDGARDAAAIVGRRERRGQAAAHAHRHPHRARSSRA